MRWLLGNYYVAFPILMLTAVDTICMDTVHCRELLKVRRLASFELLNFIANLTNYSQPNSTIGKSRPSFLFRF